MASNYAIWRYIRSTVRVDSQDVRGCLEGNKEEVMTSYHERQTPVPAAVQRKYRMYKKPDQTRKVQDSLCHDKKTPGQIKEEWGMHRNSVFKKSHVSNEQPTPLLTRSTKDRNPYPSSSPTLTSQGCTFTLTIFPGCAAHLFYCICPEFFLLKTSSLRQHLWDQLVMVSGPEVTPVNLTTVLEYYKSTTIEVLCFSK